MTSEEFVVLAKALKAAYGQQSFLADDESLKLWYRMLKDLDGSLVAAAIYSHICKNRFPPAISEIREQCAVIAMPQTRDWVEGWNAVQRAIGRWGMYRTEEALKALREEDPLTAEVAAMLGWQSLCMSENPTADRANFRICYERKQSREQERLKLPARVQGLIDGISVGFLPEGRRQ